MGKGTMFEERHQELHEAIMAWQHAEQNFREAVGQELVDAAICEMQTAELRLNYLLRRSKKGRGYGDKKSAYGRNFLKKLGRSKPEFERDC